MTDHTALIAELRERAEARARTIDPYDWKRRVADLCESRAADILTETRALLQQAVRQTTALVEKARAEQDRLEAAVRTMAADFLASKGKTEALRAELAVERTKVAVTDALAQQLKDTCNALGAAESKLATERAARLAECRRCGGDGWLEPIGPHDDGSYITSRECPRCQGSGQEPHPTTEPAKAEEERS